jgi:protein-tyrosine phosphatase
VQWRDFRPPTSTENALAVLREAYERAAEECVLLVCRGGVGRTGTALAVLAMLDGLSANASVDLVRRGYSRRAVETSGQRRWLLRIEQCL